MSLLGHLWARNITAHLTSLDPIRPKNAPDRWETTTLNLFNAGQEANWGTEIQNGREYLRYMRPFFTEKSCLNCHAFQGYKVGDLRGGISIKVPMEKFNLLKDAQMKKQIIWHLGIWAAVSGFIFFAFFLIRKNSIKIEENQKKYTQELKVINDNKDKLFAIIAHDLRSPFTAILGKAEILIDDYDSFSDAERQLYIQQMYDSSKNTFSLIQNLLAWANIQRQNTRLNKTQFDLVGITKEICTVFELACAHKEISLILANPDSAEVISDRDMIAVVIRNLINNAIKFTPRNGSISINIQKKPREVIFSITDTGTGMEQSKIDQLFRNEFLKVKDGT